MAHGVLLCGGEFLPILLLIVIISIINQALKAAQEKQARERRMQGPPRRTPPGRPVRPLSRPGETGPVPTSLEEFLRELTGGSPRPRGEEPSPSPAGTEGEPRDRGEEMRRARAQEETAERERRARAERKKRERLAREREKRDREMRESREEEERRQFSTVPDFAAAVAERQEALRKSLEGDPYAQGMLDAEHAYDVRRPEEHVSVLGPGRLRKDDIRRAIVLREVLGPPLALRKEKEDVPFL